MMIKLRAIFVLSRVRFRGQCEFQTLCFGGGPHIWGGGVNLMHFLFVCVLGDFPGENLGFWGESESPCQKITGIKLFRGSPYPLSHRPSQLAIRTYVVALTANETTVNKTAKDSG